MDRGKRVIGLLLVILSIAGLLVWEKWGKDEFLYDDVLVLKENVERGTIITESMLTTRKLDIDEDYITYKEREQIVGKQAKAFIHGGVPLFQEYVGDPNLTPDVDAGRYVLALPQEQILSSPETLSKGDKVFCFSGEKLVVSAFVSSIDTEGGVELIVSEKQASILSGLTDSGHRLVLVYQ